MYWDKEVSALTLTNIIREKGDRKKSLSPFLLFICYGLIVAIAVYAGVIRVVRIRDGGADAYADERCAHLVVIVVYIDVPVDIDIDVTIDIDAAIDINVSVPPPRGDHLDHRDARGGRDRHPCQGPS